MTSTVEYNGDLHTTCTHLLSGTAIETDAPTDNQGRGERFSPTDLLATSLGTCMITTMGIKARPLGIDLKGVSIEVLKIMKSDPRRVAGIELTFHFPPHLEALEENHKDFLKQIGLTCPVQLSIHPEIEVKVNWGSW
ncbi:MAG TPA: OsmC family protein [Chitinophagaceae bacterium]|nr:OsmC family protein [Chitinophagaceae bacterium]